MKAMIFAAGMGTRLKPYTDNLPKALVEINGKPMLFHAINKLLKYGFDDIIVNVHHFSEKIITYINNSEFAKYITISDESEELLDTGGGLLKASNLLKGNDSFLVYNVDVISNINLTKLYQYHIKSNSLATLAVKDRNSSRKLLFDENLILCGRKDEKNNNKQVYKNPQQINEYAFSGIHIINTEIFSKIKLHGTFPIMKVYMELCQSENISAYVHNDDFWMDLGTANNVETANKMNIQSYY